MAARKRADKDKIPEFHHWPAIRVFNRAAQILEETGWCRESSKLDRMFGGEKGVAQTPPLSATQALFKAIEEGTDHQAFPDQHGKDPFKYERTGYSNKVYGQWRRYLREGLGYAPMDPWWNDQQTSIGPVVAALKAAATWE